TSGHKLIDPVGFRVVRVDPATREVFDFIRNSKTKPASLLPEGQGLIERPVAVKFARDGSMYIVDFGRLEAKLNGRQKVSPHTGRILKLQALPVAGGSATAAASTQPSSSESTP